MNTPATITSGIECIPCLGNMSTPPRSVVSYSGLGNLLKVPGGTRVSDRNTYAGIVTFRLSGQQPPVPLEELTIEEWQIVVDVNLTGVFLCTQAAFRVMKAQQPRGGRIINNGSVSAYAPRPNSAPYTATKHAISGLTRSTSLDGRAYNIACGQIDIGNALTEMTEKMSAGVAQANGDVAVEPTMNVDDVARAVVYMAELPLDANVLFMTVMATNMPFVGRG